MMAALRRWLRAWLCLLLNGEHEFYLSHTDYCVYLVCVRCGFTTHGWLTHDAETLHR